MFCLFFHSNLCHIRPSRFWTWIRPEIRRGPSPQVPLHVVAVISNHANQLTANETVEGAGSLFYPSWPANVLCKQKKQKNIQNSIVLNHKQSHKLLKNGSFLFWGITFVNETNFFKKECMQPRSQSLIYVFKKENLVPGLIDVPSHCTVTVENQKMQYARKRMKRPHFTLCKIMKEKEMRQRNTRSDYRTKNAFNGHCEPIMLFCKSSISVVI